MAADIRGQTVVTSTHLRAAARTTIQVQGSSGGVVTGILSTEPNFGSGVSVLTWTTFDAGGDIKVTVPLPFHCSGSLTVVKHGSRYLISGQEYTSWLPAATRGAICKVELIPGALPPFTNSIAISGTSILASMDPFRLHWSSAEQRLYVVDYNKRRITHASWGGWSAGIPDETGFSEVANSTTLPFLSGENIDFVELMRLAPGGPGGVALSCVNDQSRIWTLVFDASNGGSYAIGERSLDNPWIVAAPMLVGGPQGFTFQLWASSTTNADYEILRANDAAVISVGSVVPGTWNGVVAPTEWFSAPGIRYDVKSQDGYVFSVYPTVRYGTPGSTSTGVSVSRGLMPLAMNIGDMDFGTGVAIEHSLTSGTAVLSYMVGLRTVTTGGTIVDPYTIVQGNHLISPLTITNVTIDMSKPISSVGRPRPIANDPELAGSVVFFQYLLTLETGEVAFSDVFGTAIVGSVSQAMNSGSDNKSGSGNNFGSGNNSRNMSGGNRSKVLALIGASPDGKLSVEDRKLFAEITKAFRQRK